MIMIELPKNNYCIKQCPACWQVVDSDNIVLAEVDSFDSAFQFYMNQRQDKQFKTEAIIYDKPAPKY